MHEYIFLGLGMVDTAESQLLQVVLYVCVEEVTPMRDVAVMRRCLRSQLVCCAASPASNVARAAVLTAVLELPRWPIYTAPFGHGSFGFREGGALSKTSSSFRSFSVLVLAMESLFIFKIYIWIVSSDSKSVASGAARTFVRVSVSGAQHENP